MKRTLWAPAYIAPALTLLYLLFNHLPLHDPCPPVNLALRFVMMDLLPILWVIPLFNWKGLTASKFLSNLAEKGAREPAPLAAPSLALILFFHESFLAVVEPSTAAPVPVGSVLWMEAATAMVAAFVLSYGTQGVKRGKGAHLWLSVILYIGLVVGGWGYFQVTGCDISRLLVFVGITSLVVQSGEA